MSRLYPFTYFGSQHRSFPFIRDRLPKTDYYIEPFGGSGVVLLNLEPTKFEVYNDLNDVIVNFFKVLRNDPDKLISQLNLTPYHRKEFENCVSSKGKRWEGMTDIEKARTFFILAQQSRYSGIDKKTKGEWQRSITQIRGGNASMPNKYRNRIEKLSEIGARLENVQFESRDAVNVIEEYDHDEAVFYIDPPYVPEVRSNSEGTYGEFEWDEGQHIELSEVLQSCEGYVALSGYQGELYQDLYKDWNVYLDEEKVNQNGKSGRKSENSLTQETLWTNYDAKEIGRGFGDRLSYNSATGW